VPIAHAASADGGTPAWRLELVVESYGPSRQWEPRRSGDHGCSPGSGHLANPASDGAHSSSYLTVVFVAHILKYMLEQTIDLDRTFQALADKSRRTMVERLTLGPASVSELAEPLAMSLAAVVQHVQVLEACGVVKTKKVGRTRMCRIEGAAMTAAEQWITDRRRGWEARLDRLGDVLNEVTATEEKP
jgi:DNA-binding transcriptional ArsR family regulator